MSILYLINRLKFFQSSCGGHVTVTSTSSKILHSLSGLSHSIPRLILSAVKGHIDSYSDGGLQTALLLVRYVGNGIGNGNGIYIPHFLYVYIQMRFTQPMNHEIAQRPDQHTLR